ncbi:molybdopterin-dependent oxidoreductase [Flexistipes sinusarabici]
MLLKVKGEKLEPKHGFLVRLFYPVRYDYKSAKWIKK